MLQAPLLNGIIKSITKTNSRITVGTHALMSSGEIWGAVMGRKGETLDKYFQLFFLFPFLSSISSLILLEEE